LATPPHSAKRDLGDHALALYFVYYNFVRIHKSLKVSPAMAAGLTDKLWNWEEVITLIDAKQEAPKKRGPYKKKIAA